jgi:hypothetical protein
MRTQEEFTKRVLGDARYAERHRFPKWNIEPTVLQEPRLFKRVFPELTKEDHIALAKKFQAKARTVDSQWYKNVDRAVKLYGEHGPYISGIYREHFPETKKEVLRRLAHGASLLYKAAHAHWDASGKRSSTIPNRDPARSRVEYVVTRARSRSVLGRYSSLAAAKKAAAEDWGHGGKLDRWEHSIATHSDGRVVEEYVNNEYDIIVHKQAGGDPERAYGGTKLRQRRPWPTTSRRKLRPTAGGNFHSGVYNVQSLYKGQWQTLTWDMLGEPRHGFLSFKTKAEATRAIQKCRRNAGAGWKTAKYRTVKQ